MASKHTHSQHAYITHSHVSTHTHYTWPVSIHTASAHTHSQCMYITHSQHAYTRPVCIHTASMYTLHMASEHTHSQRVYTQPARIHHRQPACVYYTWPASTHTASMHTLHMASAHTHSQHMYNTHSQRAYTQPGSRKKIPTNSSRDRTQVAPIEDFQLLKNSQTDLQWFELDTCWIKQQQFNH